MPWARLRIIVPIVMMLAIQLASGLPHPTYFSTLEPSLRSSASRILLAPDHRTLNLLHVPVFAVLMGLWCWSLGPWTPSRRRGMAWAGCISLGFAALNELSQATVPTRYASLSDVGLNLLGVSLGALAFSLAAALESRS